MHFTFQTSRAILTPLSRVDDLVIIVLTLMTPTSDMNHESAWASRLRQWGLSDMGLVLIEGLRPLGLVASQLIVLTTPVLSTFVAPARLAQLADWLEDPDRLEQLSSALDPEDE